MPPKLNRDQMHVLDEGAEEQWRSDRAKSKQQCLPGTGILCRQPEWCFVLVVDAVDATV